MNSDFREITGEVGKSVKGQEIRAWKFGSGPNKIGFIGGIHGNEEIGIKLIERAIEYFKEHEEEIPPEVTAVFIPSMNPDGTANKSGCNAHGVNLNGNWDYNWEFAEIELTAEVLAELGSFKDEFKDFRGKLSCNGTHPFSEPETKQLSEFLKDFKAVIFYHNNFDEDALYFVYPGRMGRYASKTLGKLIADALQYPRCPDDFLNWSDGYLGYLHFLLLIRMVKLTGAAHNYLDSKGIMACCIELPPHLDWERQYKGIKTAIDYAVNLASK